MNKKNIYLLLSLLLLAVYLFFESAQSGDFFIFLSASSDIFTGADVYQKHYVDGYHYYYGIFFGMLLKPFTWLPLRLATFLWLSLNAFFLYRIVLCCISFFKDQPFSMRQRILLIVLPLIFCMRFITDNFHIGQVTVFMLWLTLEGCRLIFMQNKWYGAVFIAFGITVKLFPLVVLPLLLYRKRLLESGLVILFTAFFYVVPALFIGIQQNNFLLHSWFSLINPANAQHVLDVEERTFHGLSTWLSVLLVKNVPDVYQLPLKRNIADVDLKTLSLILNVCRLALVSFTLFFLRSLPFKKERSSVHLFFELSYILMIVPLIFPHQQAYGFLFCLPAVFCLFFYLITQKPHQQSSSGKIVLTLLVLVYLTFNLKMLLGAFNEYYQHFKILTYGALLLIPLLALAYAKLLRKKFFS